MREEAVGVNKVKTEARISAGVTGSRWENVSQKRRDHRQQSGLKRRQRWPGREGSV